MILSESAVIKADPERLVAFFETLDEHYLDWHPDHVSFAWLDPGRESFHFVERIGRWTLRMRMRVSRSEDRRLATCRPQSALLALFFPWMTFEVRPEVDGARYTHRINLRLGPLRWLLEGTLLRPLRRHMHDESNNLARLLGTPPVA